MNDQEMKRLLLGFSNDLVLELLRPYESPVDYVEIAEKQWERSGKSFNPEGEITLRYCLWALNALARRYSLVPADHQNTIYNNFVLWLIRSNSACSWCPVYSLNGNAEKLRLILHDPFLALSSLITLQNSCKDKVPNGFRAAH